MVLGFVLWMLVPLGLAIAILYAAYATYETAQAREREALAPPPGPDPVLELERINTALAREAAHARATLEQARDTMRRGLKG